MSSWKKRLDDKQQKYAYKRASLAEELTKYKVSDKETEIRLNRYGFDGQLYYNPEDGHVTIHMGRQSSKICINTNAELFMLYYLLQCMLEEPKKTAEMRRCFGAND